MSVDENRTTGWSKACDFAGLDLIGPDAAAWFHNFCTNDVKRLRSGQGCEAFLTSLQGRTLAIARVFRTDQGVSLDLSGADVAALVKHLDKYLLMEKVNLRPTPRLAAWWIAGEQAPRTAAKAFEVESPAGLFDHVLAQAVDGVLRRVDELGHDCLQLVAPLERAADVESRLASVGAIELSKDQAELARIAWGTPHNGREVVEDRLPQDLDRDARTISFTKGCYLGQETVARLDALGHANWRLVRVDFPADAVVAAGAELTIDAKSIGHATSVAPEPGGETRTALAIVRRTSATIGATVRTRSDEGRIVPTPWKTAGV